MIGPYPGASSIAQLGTDLRRWYATEAARSAVDFHADWSEWLPAHAVVWLSGAADRKRDAAADVGTRVHEWCAGNATGKPWPGCIDGINGHQVQWLAFRRAFRPEFIHVERAVFGDGYAGSFDFIADIPGHGRLLVDIKTGKSVHPESVALQLAAYRHATFLPPADEVEMTPDHFYTWHDKDRDVWADNSMPEVDGCAVLHLRPRSHKLIPVEAGPEQHRTFLYALQLWHHLRDAGRLLGDPLTPAEEAAA